MEAGLICRAVQTERFRCDLGRFRSGAPIAMDAPSLLGRCADRLARTTLMGSADRENHLAGCHPLGARASNSLITGNGTGNFWKLRPISASRGVLRAGHEADSTACGQIPVLAETGNFCPRTGNSSVETGNFLRLVSWHRFTRDTRVGRPAKPRITLPNFEAMAVLDFILPKPPPRDSLRPETSAGADYAEEDYHNSPLMSR